MPISVEARVIVYVNEHLICLSRNSGCIRAAKCSPDSTLITNEPRGVRSRRDFAVKSLYTISFLILQKIMTRLCLCQQKGRMEGQGGKVLSVIFVVTMSLEGQPGPHAKKCTCRPSRTIASALLADISDLSVP